MSRHYTQYVRGVDLRACKRLPLEIQKIIQDYSDSYNTIENRAEVNRVINAHFKKFYHEEKFFKRCETDEERLFKLNVTRFLLRGAEKRKKNTRFVENYQIL